MLSTLSVQVVCSAGVLEIIKRKFDLYICVHMLCFQSVLYCIVLYNDVFTFLYVAVGNKLLLLLSRRI